MTRVVASAAEPLAGRLFQFSVDSFHGESAAANTPVVTASLDTLLGLRWLPDPVARAVHEKLHGLPAPASGGRD